MKWYNADAMYLLTDFKGRRKRAESNRREINGIYGTYCCG